MTSAFAYSPFEILLGAMVAVLAELGGLMLLKSGGGTALHADLSDERARPISVAVTPVVDDAPLLKLGTKKQPGKLPDKWIAPRPVERAVPQALPSPHAAPLPSLIPTTSVLDAGRPPPAHAELAKQLDTVVEAHDAGPLPVSTVEGAPDGVKEGTETDPLKAHIVSEYKARLDAFFSSRFQIRGKIPFDELKSLRAVALVNISSDRTVAGFKIVKPSGNAVFDQELQATLDSLVSSATELPPPPSPDMLAPSQTFAFQCTRRSTCE